MIYILVFFLSCTCFYFSQKYEDRKNCKFILACIGILLPAVLAGIRDWSIGTDVNVYLVKNFDYTQTLGLKDFFAISDIDKGYGLFMYIFGSVFRSANWILFFNELFIMIFIYLFAKNRKGEIPIWLTMLCFFMLFYNSSLNYMRQTLAISIILYSITKFEKKQYKTTALWFILTLFIHHSAIFAMPIYFILYNRNNKKVIFITVIALILLVLSYEKIVYYLAVDLKLLPDRYYGYIASYDSQMDIGYFDLFFRLIVLGIYIAYRFIKPHEKAETDTYITFSIIDLAILPITFKIFNANRIDLYYFYLSVLSIVPKFVLIFKKNKCSRLIAISSIFLLLFIYWYWIYVHLGFSETIPYRMLGF